MQLHEIEEHWKGWAQQFEGDLRATTKTRTIKDLEINEFYRVFKNSPLNSKDPCNVLEVGCGNGHNCFGLAQRLPHFKFTGVDFVPEMITHADSIKATDERFSEIDFFEGNILKLDENAHLDVEYDITFTNRCLINLNTHELQNQALDQLVGKTANGGYIVLIENVKHTYDQQNQLRTLAGLPARTPDKFNLFLDEPKFLEHAQQRLTLVETKDFASLHDVVLYVLVPMINANQVDYDHPLVAAATKLLLADEGIGGQFGAFGQNRIYVFQRDR